MFLMGKAGLEPPLIAAPPPYAGEQNEYNYLLVCITL